jgi:hypothetical protein
MQKVYTQDKKAHTPTHFDICMFHSQPLLNIKTYIVHGKLFKGIYAYNQFCETSFKVRV